MNKHDLIAAVAASTNLSKTDAANAVDAILTVVTKSLKKKEKVLLVGFGTFQVTKRKAGEGRNPQTGEIDLRTLTLIGGYRGRQQSIFGPGFNFGVYATTLTPGRVSVGDLLQISTA